MSVLSYLTSLSSQLVLSTTERISIGISIGNLETNLKKWSHFTDIQEHTVFGSYDRETILPRKYDEGSDVDYMIVFNNTNNYQPETYRTWLKKFAEDYYTRSEIYLDYPTTVLELSHIKFELVPAIKPYWGTYMIPDNTTLFSKWQSTNPFSLKSTITEANKVNHNVRPLIRLMKYWNVRSGKPYASFELEQKIANMPFWYSKNLEECFYFFVEALMPDYAMSQAHKNAVNRLKNHVRQAQYYKQMGLDGLAENEIKTIFN